MPAALGRVQTEPLAEADRGLVQIADGEHDVVEPQHAATLAEGPTYTRDVIRRLLPLVVLVVALVPSTAHALEVPHATVRLASVRGMVPSALHGQAGQIESVSPSPSVRPKEEEPHGGVVSFGGILIAGVLVGGLLLMRSRLLRR